MGCLKGNLKLITIITTSIVLASSFKIYTAKDIWQGSFDIVLSDEKSENLPISNLNLEASQMSYPHIMMNFQLNL